MRPGDVIATPFNSLHPLQITDDNSANEKRISHFRVTNVSDFGNFRYRWLYFRCDLELLTGDQSIRIEHN